MESMLLTPYDGAFLGPIAKILGWIMEVVYNFMYNTFGIESVGLSIIMLFQRGTRVFLANFPNSLMPA